MTTAKSASSAADGKEKAVMTEFYQKIGYPIHLTLTCRKILTDYAELDANSKEFVSLIGNNQYLEFMLLQHLKGFGLKEASPELKTVVALLGMQGLRNFICALYMMRLIEKKHPDMQDDGKLEFKVSDYLKYSVKTEEWAQARFLPFAEMAFTSGLVFDLITLVAKSSFNVKNSFFEQIDETYKHGMQTAKVGIELAQTFKNFNLSKYTFSACLIHDVGKLVMELLYPKESENSYGAFRDQIGKSKVFISREVRHFLERKKFGYSHDFFSSQVAFFFAPLRPMEKALLFHHDPYLIKNSAKDHFMLASVIALATNMASNFRNPKDEKDPLLKRWLTFELKDLKMDPNQLVKLARHLIQMKQK